MAKASIINLLLPELKVSLHKLEKTSGISNGTIRKAMDRDAELSLEIIEKIASKYPQVSRKWLLTGEPPIIIASSTESEEGSTLLTKLLTLFNMLPENKKTSEAYELYSDMIKEVGELKENRQQLLDEMREKNNNK